MYSAAVVLAFFCNAWWIWLKIAICLDVAPPWFIKSDNALVKLYGVAWSWINSGTIAEFDNKLGKEIYLTSVEFDILCYLYASAGKPIAVEELLQKVMNYPSKTGNPETIRTHIKNIRAKIDRAKIYFNYF